MTDCILTQLFESLNHPHRAWVSCHGIPYANGLIRSELTLLVGMMMIRMRREDEEFIDDNTLPVGARCSHSETLMLKLLGG